MGHGGEASTPQGAAHSDQSTLNDPQFAPFLLDSFDSAQFASNALANAHTTAQTQIEHLQQGIALLDTQVRHLVLGHRDELIQHTSKLDDTDASLQRISLSVRSLQSVAARVRAEVMEPYQQFVAKTEQLKNVQLTVDLLRHTIHRLKLVQRLRVEAASGSGDIVEIAKTARLLSEIAAADAEADLSGIAAVDQDDEFLASANAEVRTKIDAALRTGLAALSQADVGSALQALYNLQELRHAVAAHIDSSAASLERIFSAALDARKLSSSGAAAPSSGVRSVVGVLQSAPARVQDALWQRLGEAFESLWRSGVAAWHLQRVLMKKRDPLTHELFIDVVAPSDADQLPLDRFWGKAAGALSRSFASVFSAQRGGLVRDALVGYYPRLAGMLEQACTRIIKDGSARDAPLALSPHHTAALLGVARDAEAAYLSTAQSRLECSVAAVFQGGPRALPSAADLQTLVANIHEELKAAAEGGERLATLTAAVVGGSLAASASRAEMMAAGGPEVRSVGNSCTASQARNITLCNALQEIHRSVGALAPRLPASAAQALIPSLEAVQGAALDLVAPLFRAMVDAAQDRIQRLHALNLSADEGAEGSVVETSTCMRDVVRLLANYRTEYLSKFTPPPSMAGAVSVARALVERMASRLMIFYVRHAALVRPLSLPGKLQLAKDAAELESAIEQHLVPTDVLGSPVRALRGCRRLLFLETSEIESSPALKDVPPTAAVHHLFSRLPENELESPHMRNKLTLSQYSLWLDQHTEEEALKFIKIALEAGAAKALAQPGGEEVVAVMRRVLAEAGAA